MPSQSSFLNTLKYRENTRILWKLTGVPIGALMALSARAVERTSHINVQGPGADYKGPAIYVHWHEYLPYFVTEHGRHHRTILMSGAPYMEAISTWNRLLGVQIIHGATGLKGKEALPHLADALQHNESVVFAVDGPAGPAHKTKPGCVLLAMQTKLPIIPMWYRCKRGIVAKARWDHSRIPLLGATIDVHYGTPIFLTSSSLDENIAIVQAALNGPETAE